MSSKAISAIVGLALLACALAGVPGGASAKVLSIDDHLTVEEGSTREWDGGDYVALNMTKGDSLAWFGVVYGNETHANSVTIVSAYIRFLGGAEVRSESGGMMIPATGIPVLTIYVQKLFALIEFSDTGYLEPWRNETVGAGNGLFDFKGAGSHLHDFGISSVEPVHKIVDLNRSWERSEITEVRTLGTTEKEWEFTLSSKNMLYDKIWDNERPQSGDGSRPGRESDGKVHEVAFAFHMGTKLDAYNVSVPWYRITTANGQVVSSQEQEPRNYSGTSLTTEFKFDHIVNGWDFEGADNLLMLETGTVFGTFVPSFVQSWLNVQFVNATAQDAPGIAEIETFTGGAQDIDSTDGLPEGTHELSKDTITFRDNWQKVGEMSWVSNVTVDREEKEMRFQIHAGENIDWETEKRDGRVRGIVFLGGYIYPMGHDIYHDPSFVAHALFLDLPIGGGNGLLAILVGAQGIALIAGICAVAVYVVRRKK
ncbi:MAG: hypothetical protein HZB92_01400 [Euryarchaeota archaeon]|nr:hypothetical protein [Euryarchaeota archaeon]